MGHIAVERAEPGMVLQADVVDLRGRLLIPAGRELTDRNVTALPMWGITHIEVEGEETETPIEAEIDDEMVAAAEAQVADRFANAGGPHPFLDALRSSCAKRVARSLALAARPAGEVVA